LTTKTIYGRLQQYWELGNNREREMAHEEYVVLEDRADGTGDVIEVSVHKTEGKAIEECNKQHKDTGKYYEVEYLLVEGTKVTRQIIETDYTYSIGERE
jgi:hypothetical protein